MELLYNKICQALKTVLYSQYSIGMTATRKKCVPFPERYPTPKHKKRLQNSPWRTSFSLLGSVKNQTNNFLAMPTVSLFLIASVLLVKLSFRLHARCSSSSIDLARRSSSMVVLVNPLSIHLAQPSRWSSWSCVELNLYSPCIVYSAVYNAVYSVECSVECSVQCTEYTVQSLHCSVLR